MEEAKFMDITPEIAEKMLGKNTNNYRRLNSSTVAKYAKDMFLGYWQVNGETIVFSKDGTLLNGQNRLAAIIKSNTTQKMLVVTGVSADIYDSGKVRSWQEYTHTCPTIGGAIVCVLSMLGSIKANQFSTSEKYEYYEKFKDEFDRAYLFAIKGSRSAILKKSGCVAAIYCALKLKLMPEKSIEDFCEIVNSGFPIDGYACESPLVLRKFLMETKLGCGHVFIRDMFEITWQAMNAFRRGLKSKRSFKPDGKGRDVITQVQDLERRFA